MPRDLTQRRRDAETQKRQKSSYFCVFAPLRLCVNFSPRRGGEPMASRDTPRAAKRSTQAILQRPTRRVRGRRAWMPTLLDARVRARAWSSEGQPAAGDDGRHMRMELEIPGPRVQHHRDAELGTQALRVTPELEQRRRRRREEQERPVPRADGSSATLHRGHDPLGGDAENRAVRLGGSHGRDGDYARRSRTRRMSSQRGAPYRAARLTGPAPRMTWRSRRSPDGSRTCCMR
jgi:hypothetical protein